MSEFGGKPTKQCVQRLQREFVALQREPNELFSAAPDPMRICHWYYVINGPSDTPYANGRYIGEIFFPSNYPFAPPSISMLTPNGRFEVGQKICMSNTEFHRSSWSPLWNVASIINGLCSHWTSEEGGVGTIEQTADERRKLAMASRKYNLDKLSCVYKRVLPECYDADFAIEFPELCNTKNDDSNKEENSKNTKEGSNGEKKCQRESETNTVTTGSGDNNENNSIGNTVTSTNTNTAATTSSNINHDNMENLSSGDVIVTSTNQQQLYKFTRCVKNFCLQMTKPSMICFSLFALLVFILVVIAFFYRHK